MHTAYGRRNVAFADKWHGAAPFGRPQGSGIFPYGWVPGETPPSLGAAYGSEYLASVWEEGWNPGDSTYTTGHGIGPVEAPNLGDVWDVVGDIFEKGAEIVPQIIRPKQVPTGEVVYKPSWEAAREIALREAGEYIARTPEGQEAIRQEAARQAAAKVQPFVIPAAIGGAALLFILLSVRR